ncbi:hypothetical protein Ct61P_15278 [Colletotrichum tofieldiae]|nr:hypothetical protein Ct61P_15278 [Colletotrichum tofieldiae]
MEFDYQRWRAWGAWREGAGPAVSEGRRGRPRRDCWQECQYPSECHHLRAMRRGRGDAGSGFRATAVDEQPVSPPSSPPSLSPLLRSAVTCPDVEVGDGRSVSAADGCLDHDGCFMAAMNEGPGLEPGRTFDPVMLEGSLMSVVAGRLRRDGGWRSDDECPSCDEVEDVKMGDGKPMV